MSLKQQINPTRLPKHVAIIMDGNGRWARTKGNIRVFGHRSAIKAVRDTTESAAELGLDYLTLFAFSTENWNRPKAEVNALMKLLVETIRKETATLMDNDIKLNAIGHLDRLPGNCGNQLKEAIELTSGNQRMTLTLALSYGARADITDMVRKLANSVKEGVISPEDINEKMVSSHLSTANIPDPELLIRTSGEFRVSNFLLWEIAYSEIFITKKLWPDFRREDLFEAIIDFQQRERRFGKISEQIQSN
ncbi:MAG: isoprenyl transferase [Bacteroidetes bacterium]|nr:isoprenyl transferase [Bacteroidota bacterium]MCB0852756.1 isoprenyl transferase [Bacteroidota bacterium]